MTKIAILRNIEPEDSYFCAKGGIHKYNNFYLDLMINGKGCRVNAKKDIEEVWGTDSFSNSEIAFMRKTMPISVVIYDSDGNIHVTTGDLKKCHKAFKKYRSMIYDMSRNKRA